jgi:hypothetical protein
MIYSSKKTGCFHDSNLGGELPEDAIEISTELHAELLSGQSQLTKINFDTEPPSLIEREPASPQLLADIERAWRDVQLVRTDGLVARQRDELDIGSATTLTVDQYTELLTYRRELRDWPQGADFPLSEHRPVAPPWLFVLLQ